MAKRKTIKKGSSILYLIPHKHNDYQPHFFRNTSLFIVFSFCVLLLGISIGNFIFLQKTVLGANIASNVLIDMANSSRTQNKVPPLIRNKKLDYAANMKVEDMITNKYFSHNSPDGTTPWYFMHEAGYNFLYAGENLAINFFDSVDVQNAWMNSPTHRANLLNSKFKEIGIGTKEGLYNGANSIYIVQMFGTEAQAKLENVFGDYKKEIDAKQNVVEDARIAIEKPAKLDSENIKVIQSSKDFVAVKNIEAIEKENSTNTSAVAGAEKNASLWEMIIFNISRYIEIIYFAILFLVAVAFLIRIFIEYERQHYKHILYSLGFLVLIILIAFINYNFIISHL